MRKTINSVCLALCVLCFAPSSYGNGDGEIDYRNPENILKFADYLFQEGDYLRAIGEYQRYLFHSPEDSDAMLYKIGLCYGRAGDIGQAISFFRRIDTRSPLRFAASYQIAYIYLASGQYESSIRSLDQALNEAKNEDERRQLSLLTAFNYLHQRRWADAEHILGSQAFRDEGLANLASSLKRSAREGMSLPSKNSMLAGLFSAAVPGTGKMYCRQYGDGVYSLILIAITGLLAWDGFQENGIRSARGWIFGSMSAVFYFGNVYGSTIAARIYNHQLETSILNSLPRVPDDYYDAAKND